MGADTPPHWHGGWHDRPVALPGTHESPEIETDQDVLAGSQLEAVPGAPTGSRVQLLRPSGSWLNSTHCRMRCKKAPGDAQSQATTSDQAFEA